MISMKRDSHVKRHISFSPREDALVRARADRVGMAIVPYIKHMALHGRSTGYKLQTVLEHSAQISKVAQELREGVYRQDPDSWLYEAQLRYLTECAEKLIAMEAEFLELMKQRLK